jgi:hypothetical protein
MLNGGLCTVRGGKKKRLKSEINFKNMVEINMVQGIKRYLDRETIESKILIIIVAKRETKALKLNFPPNHSII